MTHQPLKYLLFNEGYQLVEGGDQILAHKLKYSIWTKDRKGNWILIGLHVYKKQAVTAFKHLTKAKGQTK